MSMRLPGTEYKRVFGSGRVLRGRLMSAWTLPNSGCGRRVGVVVSKKSFHLAVDRNRAKRLMREAFRRACDRLPEDCDWVLVGRSPISCRRMQDVESELRWMCGRC